jgi:hypothetical protein
MEAVCFSETLVSTYKSTRRYYTEDQHLQVTGTRSFSLQLIIHTTSTGSHYVKFVGYVSDVMSNNTSKKYQVQWTSR